MRDPGPVAGPASFDACVDQLDYLLICRRWVSGASTFSGKRLQIMLDDETTGQQLACLEGPRSLLHKSEPDTLVIRGNKQELGDTEWVRLVVGSALVKAWQCRRNNQDGVPQGWVANVSKMCHSRDTSCNGILHEAG